MAVERTPALMALAAELKATLKERLDLEGDRPGRPFHPHVTVAYSDLKRGAFKAAWPEFETRPFEGQWTGDRLTLLQHENKKWHVFREFPFTADGQNP